MRSGCKHNSTETPLIAKFGRQQTINNFMKTTQQYEFKNLKKVGQSDKMLGTALAFLVGILLLVILK